MAYLSRMSQNALFRIAAVLALVVSAWPLAAAAQLPDGNKRSVTDSVMNTARMSDEWMERFSAEDLRARRILARIECAQLSGEARKAGLFGGVALGNLQSCVVAEKVLAGAYYDAEPPFNRVERLKVVKLFASKTAYTGRVDTMALLAEARALFAARKEADGMYRMARLNYGPVVIRGDGDSLEVWLVPPGTAALGQPMLGGMTGFVFSPDGKQLVRRVNEFSTRRMIGPPSDTAMIVIAAREQSFPSTSALVLARALARIGQPVVIDLANHQALLAPARQGTAPVWMQRAR